MLKQLLLTAVLLISPLQVSMLAPEPAVAHHTQQQATFTLSDLTRAGINKANAQAYLPWLNKYAPRYGVTTRLRKIHFLTQISHESLGFAYTTEPTGYRYEWNRQLGNVYRGDGHRFRGRGLI